MKKNESGSILVTILAITMFLSMVLVGLVVLANANLVRARSRILILQAQYSAESGADAAIAKLNEGIESYAGSGGEVLVLNGAQYRSTFKVSVENGATPKERWITSTGYVYSPKNSLKPKYIRKIRVGAERTSSMTASSMLSRTVIDIASGVKNVWAKEVYVNDYIRIQKNTNTLTAEHISVAGRDNNCSIFGSGKLAKPSTFNVPGQTKTILDLAYNNCITPPGNTSNADFEVNANRTDMHKIQSLRIPWSQYMDGSYQNSIGGCDDWTTGGSTRDIPRVGNDRKTHYPNSLTTVSTACPGGDLALGSNTFVIRNHAHVRASFCAASACNPIFKNPDTDVKYVFIDGTINFDSIRTTSGSGPIVFVTYGTDPASKTGQCPTGGSIYLGKSNIETKAPAAYLLASFGACVYQTKFASPPSLGGIAGKSIFVSSNAGNPWDLYLDPSFPVNQIPIDLSWRQSSYMRL